MTGRCSYLGVGALAFLLVTPLAGIAEDDLALVTSQRAKELGLELRTTGGARSNLVRVELSFEMKGGMADFDNPHSRIDLEVREGEKLRIVSALKDVRTPAGRVSAAFGVDRAEVGKVRLVVVTQVGGGRTGYSLQLKDFVETKDSR